MVTQGSRDLQVVLRLQDRFSGPMKNANRSLANMGQSATATGRRMSARLTLPLLGIAAASLKVAGDFQQSMNQVRAVSGATGDEFDKLSEQAKYLGATTQYTAAQAASAMGFLAMAGFNATEVLGAMPSTLQLAAAGQLDLARAADITSNILTGYRLDVTELGHANDVLVKTFTSSNTNLEQLGEAFKFIAPVASSAGVQFEEAAAAVGLLGNAGIQASMAGTTLRQAIAKMLTPTEEASVAMSRLGINATNADGSLKTLEEIVRQVGSSGATTADIFTMFGIRAGPGMSALVGQGADALAALTAKLEDSGGTADKIASVQMEGFNGAMRELRSALEGALIALAESGLLEAMTAFAGHLTTMFRQLSKVNPEILKWAAGIGGVIAISGPAVLAFGLIATGISGVAAASSALLLVWTPLLAALAAGAAIGWTLGASVEAAGNAIMNLTDNGKRETNALKIMRNEFDHVKEAVKDFMLVTEEASEVVGEFPTYFATDLRHAADETAHALVEVRQATEAFNIAGKEMGAQISKQAASTLPMFVGVSREAAFRIKEMKDRSEDMNRVYETEGENTINFWVRLKNNIAGVSDEIDIAVDKTQGLNENFAQFLALTGQAGRIQRAGLQSDAETRLGKTAGRSISREEFGASVLNLMEENIRRRQGEGARNVADIREVLDDALVRRIGAGDLSRTSNQQTFDLVVAALNLSGERVENLRTAVMGQVGTRFGNVGIPHAMDTAARLAQLRRDTGYAATSGGAVPTAGGVNAAASNFLGGPTKGGTTIYFTGNVNDSEAVAAALAQDNRLGAT